MVAVRKADIAHTKTESKHVETHKINAQKWAYDWVRWQAYGRYPKTNESPSEAELGVFFKVAMICCKGDGTISKQERDYIVGALAIRGVSETMLKQFETMNPTESLSDVLSLMKNAHQLGVKPFPGEKEVYGRVALHYAIGASEADGYGVAEAKQIHKAAEILGIKSEVVQTIEGLIDATKGLRLSCQALTYPYGQSAVETTGTVKGKEALASRFMANQSYGFQKPFTTIGSYFIKALLSLAGADGKISASECQWILGFGAAYGVSETELHALEKYDGKEDLIKILPQDMAKHGEEHGAARSLILRGIQAASVDGYHKAEQTKIHQVAKQLHVPEAIVLQLEELVKAQISLANLRYSVLYPKS